MRVKTALGVLSLAVLIAGGCSQKPDGNAAKSDSEKSPDAEKAPASEAQIELTAAQASAGADASVTIPERRETVSVKIPPGVKDGVRLRLKGMGAPAPDGAPRDFFIRIRVK